MGLVSELTVVEAFYPNRVDAFAPPRRDRLSEIQAGKTSVGC